MGEMILFADIPKLDDLCCITMIIDTKEKKDPSVKSDYQWQILKSRILIFYSADVIASPVIGSLLHIYVIVSKANYTNGFFCKLAEATGLKYLKPQEVTNTVFEACLKYTLVARLAPNWNQVGGFLIKGRGFLTSSQKLTGIKVNVQVSVNEVAFLINVCAINLPKVNVEDLLYEFYDSKRLNQNITYNISNRPLWVYVLPSMKRGRITAVSKIIPLCSPFKDYKELKRHWKNTYGYRLPDSEEGMIYVAVNFFGNILFTYPICCVRSGPPIVVPNTYDSLPAVQEFVSDLNLKFPKLCDIPLVVNYKIGYTDPKIGSIHTDPAYHERWNTTAIPLKKKYRTLQELADRNAAELAKEAAPVRWHHNPLSAPGRIKTEDQQEEEHGDDFASQAVSLSSQSTVLQKIKISTSPDKVNRRMVPKFIVRNREHVVKSPLFLRTETDNKMEARPDPSCNLSEQVTNLPHKPVFSKPTAVLALKSMFGSCFKNNTSKNVVGIKSNNQNKENDVPRIDPPVRPSEMKAELKFPTFKSKSAPIADRKKPLQQSPSPSRAPDLKLCAKREGTPLNLTSEKPKKVYSKPKVQEVDVECLARQGGLVKVNAATLIAYLKQNGVPTKARDKKTDLMNKVYQHLNLTRIDNIQQISDQVSKVE